MSTKFSISNLNTTPPPACGAPPKPPLPPGTLATPLRLIAWARWFKMFELPPHNIIADVTQLIQLPKTSDIPIYHGFGPRAYQYLELKIQYSHVTALWGCWLTIHGAELEGVEAAWLNIYIDPTKPFDTGPLEKITHPTYIYQLARALE